VAEAAANSGVARRPIADMDAYVDQLNRFVFRSGLIMKPLFTAAKAATKKRVIFAEGEDERVLRAAQVLLEEEHCRTDPDRPSRHPRKPLAAVWSQDQARRRFRPSSTPRTIRASATMSTNIFRLSAASA
jgi:hypothetical protein